MRLVALLSIALSLGACASVPAVTITYYSPKAVTKVTVSQALDCDKDKTQVFSANSVTFTTVYSADRSAPHPLHITDLDGPFSDSNLGFTFTEDGRLKGVNAQTTGEAATVITSAITLAGAVAAPLGGAPTKKTPTACEIIANWGKDKPLTLTYSATFDPGTVPAGGILLQPTADSEDLYKALSGFNLPELSLSVRAGVPQSLSPPVIDGGGNAEVINLMLNNIDTTHLDIKTSKNDIVGEQDVLFPVSGSYYSLPIPKSKLFGQQTFAVTLADSGAVTAVTYAKLTGVSSAVGSAGAIATAAKPESAADRATEYQSQADELAQLARLARCRANPIACT